MRPFELNILLVDDDERSLESMAHFLGDDGHRTYTATAGSAAIDLVRELKRENLRLDLSILDYHMPDLTGIDVYGKLTAELPGLEAVFVSGEASAKIRFDISTVGGRALVPKPIDIQLMRSVLEEFWRERREKGFV